jgi:hypothetical protein
MRCVVGLLAALAIFVLESPMRAQTQTPAAPSSDLDTFMAQVLARRDDNWKKLQQYILDEQERAELHGPGRMLVWGEKREYVWYLREGYFVRSPVRANGVAIGENDREKYEQDFLKRARERDQRSHANAENASAPPPPADVQSLIQQTREPQFISSAYFLEFKFEAGKYALVGRENIGGRDVLRIEYYPTRLFSDEPNTRAEARSNQATGRNSKKEDAYGDEIQRLMNKVSLVTLWVEPAQKQIVKYTFDNIGLDFLPAAWLVRVTDLKANMLMTEAFPGVWLPKRIDMSAAILLAPGPLSMTYDIEYSGYREAATSSKYRGVSGR